MGLLFQICVIQRRDMDAPVDSSCLETTEVSRKTKIRLGLSSKKGAFNPVVEEGDIEELLKSDQRYFFWEFCFEIFVSLV